MKLAIISDLHSNREALDEVFKHIESQGITEIACLGDVVGYGPEPEFCVDMVRNHAKWCLMGNHDEAVFADASDFNPHARKAVEFTRRRLQPAWYSSSEKKARWRWLKALPLRREVGRFLFVHGSPRDPVREYVLSTDGILNPDKLQAVFASFDGIAVAGHTHQPGMHDENFRFHGLNGEQTCTMELPEGKKCFLNVGSTGQPRDSDNRACYAVLEDHQITWHRVEYDYRATMEKIQRTGVLHDILARRLAVGK